MGYWFVSISTHTKYPCRGQRHAEPSARSTTRTPTPLGCPVTNRRRWILLVGRPSIGLALLLNLPSRGIVEGWRWVRSTRYVDGSGSAALRLRVRVVVRSRRASRWVDSRAESQVRGISYRPSCMKPARVRTHRCRDCVRRRPSGATACGRRTPTRPVSATALFAGGGVQRGGAIPGCEVAAVGDVGDVGGHRSGGREAGIVLGCQPSTENARR
jgi:hypothetical protein